mmetsp:Transcript_40818/g.49526  ORF Transcript_40818/g.49526 Transcript_40818/m.49526 type:complete len:460 (+) Transcript_40818:125-1504(+)
MDMFRESVADLHTRLLDQTLLLPARYRAMFSLRGVGTEEAVDALLDGLEDTSALFRHEIAFCLGQMQTPRAVRKLIDVLENTLEHPMVRHEAAEALGAINTPECYAPLYTYQNDAEQEVAESCWMSVRRIESAAKGVFIQRQDAYHRMEFESCGRGRDEEERHHRPDKHQASKRARSAKEQYAAAARAEYLRALEATSSESDSDAYCSDSSSDRGDDEPRSVNGHSFLADSSALLSVDPAPAFSTDTPCEYLSEILHDEEKDLFSRYAAMFALRDKGGPEEVASIEQAMRSAKSALLKHEVAFVLGQLQVPGTEDVLIAALCDETENGMVRHEAAEALGSIGSPKCTAVLEQYREHEDPVVAESCAVALDILHNEMSDEISLPPSSRQTCGVIIDVQLFDSNLHESCIHESDMSCLNLAPASAQAAGPSSGRSRKASGSSCGSRSRKSSAGNRMEAWTS